MLKVLRERHRRDIRDVARRLALQEQPSGVGDPLVWRPGASSLKELVGLDELVEPLDDALLAREVP